MGERRHRKVFALEQMEKSHLFIQQTYVLHPAGTRLCKGTGCKHCVRCSARPQRPHQLLAEADQQTKVTPSGRAVVKRSGGPEAPVLPLFEPPELVEGGGSRGSSLQPILHASPCESN